MNWWFPEILSRCILTLEIEMNMLHVESVQEAGQKAETTGAGGFSKTALLAPAWNVHYQMM